MKGGNDALVSLAGPLQLFDACNWVVRSVWSTHCTCCLFGLHSCTSDRRGASPSAHRGAPKPNRCSADANYRTAIRNAHARSALSDSNALAAIANIHVIAADVYPGAAATDVHADDSRPAGRREGADA